MSIECDTKHGVQGHVPNLSTIASTIDPSLKVQTNPQIFHKGHHTTNVSGTLFKINQCYYYGYEICVYMIRYLEASWK